MKEHFVMLFKGASLISVCPGRHGGPPISRLFISPSPASHFSNRGAVIKELIENP